LFQFLKHSKTSKSIIHLRENENNLLLTVVDNGVDFYKEKVVHKDGLGINHIEARIIVTGGCLKINFTLGKGTEIIIQIPVQGKHLKDLV